MEQNNYWRQYWQEFLDLRKLKNFVSEMNEVDELLGNAVRIEDICRKIYEDYQGNWKDHLERVRADFLRMLEKLLRWKSFMMSVGNWKSSDHKQIKRR